MKNKKIIAYAAAAIFVAEIVPVGSQPDNMVSAENFFPLYQIFLSGDCNMDNAVNAEDVKLLQQYLVNKVDFDYTQKSLADLNSDNSIDVFDVIKLRRSLLNKVPEPPVTTVTNVPNTTVTTVTTTTIVTTQSPEEKVQEYVERVVEIANEERAKSGIAPLKLNQTLVDAAMLRAEETSEKFSHTRPDGTSCFTVLGEYGLGYSYCAENIAAGKSTPEDTMNQWINSKGHYENIMNPNLTEIGVGYYYLPDSVYKCYWVQLFRTP